jgi:hypothetical protein
LYSFAPLFNAKELYKCTLKSLSLNAVNEFATPRSSSVRYIHVDSGPFHRFGRVSSDSSEEEGEEDIVEFVFHFVKINVLEERDSAACGGRIGLPLWWGWISVGMEKGRRIEN